MSWPSVIILVPAERRPSLEGRIRCLGLVPDPATGDERLHQHGYSYCIDLSGGILGDYEPEELEQVTTRIGEPYAVYVSCQSMDAARAFLREVLPGVADQAQVSSSRLASASCSPAGPDQDGGEVQCRLVGDSEFLRRCAGRQARWSAQACD